MDNGVRLIRTTDLASGELSPEESGIYVPEEAVDAESRLAPGDLLLSRSGTIGRAFLAPAAAEGMAFAGFLVRFRPKSDTLGKYLYYCTQSSEFQAAVTADAVSSTIQNFNAEKYENLAVPLPSFDEQRAIANYLDRETQKIDELITEQRGLIETLRERRRAAISAAIQPHDLQGWGRLPLRYAIQFQEGPGIGAADFRESGVPLLRISSIRGAVATLEGVNYLDPKTVDSRWSHFKVETGDLLINSSASMGSVAEVLDDEVVGSIPYTGIIRVRAGLMVKEFARWYFESDAFMHQIELLKTGSTIQHYGPMHLRQVRVSLPEQHRQLEIARNLDGQTSRIDELISESEDLIALSQERRAALITAAVTGQIDVRTAA